MTSQVIRHTDCYGSFDPGDGSQGGLDFVRVDAFACSVDHVRAAPEHVQIAVMEVSLISDREVAVQATEGLPPSMPNAAS